MKKLENNKEKWTKPEINVLRLRDTLNKSLTQPSEERAVTLGDNSFTGKYVDDGPS